MALETDSTPPFAVAVSCADGTWVLHVTGEIDMANCSQLRKAGERLPRGGAIRVDLLECTFIDSQGLWALCTLGRERPGSTLIVGEEHGLGRVLAISGLDEVYDVVQRARPAGEVRVVRTRNPGSGRRVLDPGALARKRHLHERAEEFQNERAHHALEMGHPEIAREAQARAARAHDGAVRVRDEEDARRERARS